jgi:hypothetical protein
VPSWGVLGAAVSLLTAGGVALAGLVPAVWPYRNALLGADRKEAWHGLWQNTLPLVALVVPLLLVPDGGRIFALLKLGLAVLAYVLTLVLVHPWSLQGSEHRLTNLFSQFVEIFIGG